MKTLITIIILAAVVLTGLLIWLWMDIKNSFVAEETAPIANALTYTNSANGYSLKYPADLQVKEYTPDIVTIGKIEGDMVNGVAEIRALSFLGQKNQTFEQAAGRELQKFCAADGPYESFSCTGIESASPFASASGLNGFAVYLKGELKNLRTGTTTAVTKGPYYVFATKSSATGSRVIVISAPLNQNAAEAESGVIRQIANSLQINAPVQSDNSIESYISSRISELSPVKEVLGGKFYVTKIEAHGGTGTVWYEDGHIALVADFTYSVDPQGNLKINSFTVRK